MMVGIVIGPGIFLTTGIMAQSIPSAPLLMLAWLVGGLVTLAGALTFAELGAAMPHAGGQYVYLRAGHLGRRPHPHRLVRTTLHLRRLRLVDFLDRRHRRRLRSPKAPARDAATLSDLGLSRGPHRVHRDVGGYPHQHAVRPTGGIVGRAGSHAAWRARLPLLAEPIESVRHQRLEKPRCSDMKLTD